MTDAEIKSTYQNILHLLEKQRLKEALERLQLFATPLSNWHISEKISDLQNNYRMMLRYFFDGVTDPERHKLFVSLLANAYKLAEEIKEALLERDSHNYVFSQKRYFPFNQAVGINELFTQLQRMQDNRALSGLVEDSLHTSGKRKDNALQHEIYSNQLFKTLWLSVKYTDEETSLIKDLLASDTVALSDKCLAVSALMLSLLRSFDEDRLMLLIDFCIDNELAVSQRAMVSLLPVLAKYDLRLAYFPAIRNRLVVLFDNSMVCQHIKHILLQYARTNETEKISKKLKEEILPEMMKVAPKLKDKISLDNLMNSDDPDEKNPEWQEILQNSGIADKLKEFSDLQMEGSDVYMSTFAMLKSFSFFNEAANWFKPFDVNQAAIMELFENDGESFLAAMMNNGYMCNSDRYSFCLSLMQMPSTQREMMGKAFTMEAQQLKEIQHDEVLLSGTKQAELISNAYIQDLYRFFHLFPQKNDFETPFEYSLKFQDAWFYALIGFTIEEEREIAEYYFSKDFYRASLNYFQKIEQQTSISLDLCQKIGYCYQKLGDIDAALANYLQAEIIAPNQKWTVRKIAYCYRMLKNYSAALTFYLKAAESTPDNLLVLSQIGNCYLHLNQHDEALSYYFKVEYVTKDNVEMWRAIAWTSFLAGKMDQAKKFLKKALAFKEDWTDYLHLGHIAFVESDKKEAISNYEKAFLLSDHKLAVFIDTFFQDAEQLKAKGVDAVEMAILVDYLRYAVD